MYHIDRPIFERNNFDQEFPKKFHHSGDKLHHFLQSAKNDIKKRNNKKICVGWIINLIPCISWLLNYKQSFLLQDIIAGLTVAFMHIPQSMAYVALVPLPPVYGLYTSFFPVLVYCFFGTSKHISLGTYAVVSIMIGNVVTSNLNAHTKSLKSLDTFSNISSQTNLLTSVSTPSPQDAKIQLAISIALSISLLVGIMQIAMGIFRIGFITMYMSTPIVRGFTTGAAFYVFSSQLQPLFGLSNLDKYQGAFSLLKTWYEFAANLRYSHIPTVALSITCILVLISTKALTSRFKSYIRYPIPIEFLLILIGTGVSYYLNLKKNGIKVVGKIPEGLPSFQVPTTKYWSSSIPSAFAIAMVAFFTSYSMAKILGEKHNYDVSSNKELFAYGLASTIGSCFSAIACSASLSRSLVQENVGGQTQLTGFISCLLLLAVILKIGPIFEPLPRAILAAIIMVALRGMFYQLCDVPQLYRKNRVDMSIFLVTFFATVILDVDIGLAIGVLYGLLTLIVRTQRPSIKVLGHLPNTEMYADLRKYSSAQPIPGILIYSFNCFIYYANATIFRDNLYSRYKWAEATNQMVFTNEENTSPTSHKKINGITNGKLSPLRIRKPHSSVDLNDHHMKILDRSHSTFTPVELVKHIKKTSTLSPNKNDRSNRKNSNNAYENDIIEDEFGDAPPSVLTRYNSLIESGTRPIVQLVRDPFSPLPILTAVEINSEETMNEGKTKEIERDESSSTQNSTTLNIDNDSGNRETEKPKNFKSLPQTILSNIRSFISGSNGMAKNLSEPKQNNLSFLSNKKKRQPEKTDVSKDVDEITKKLNEPKKEGEINGKVNLIAPLTPTTEQSIRIGDSVNSDLVKSAPEFHAKNVKAIIIDYTYVSFVDTVGIETLVQIVKDFKEIGVYLYFAACNDNVMDALERSKFTEHFGRDQIFLTIHDAVLNATSLL